MSEYQSEIENILSRYPQYNKLFDDDEYPTDLTEYDYAHFVCIQIYHQYNTIFIPIMLPGCRSYILNSKSGLYGHTCTKIDQGSETRLWSLIKFTPMNIIHRELTGKLSFTKK
jgi:hypothetical protein